MTGRFYITSLLGWTSQSLNCLIICYDIQGHIEQQVSLSSTLNDPSVCFSPLLSTEAQDVFPFRFVFFFTGAEVWVGWWCIWYSLFIFIKRCSHGTLSQFMGALTEKQWRCSRVEIENERKLRTGSSCMEGCFCNGMWCVVSFLWCTVCGGVCQ